MAIGLGSFLIANSFLNAALRRGEKSSDLDESVKRQACLEIQRHKNRLEEQEKQQELSHQNRQKELKENHDYRKKEQEKAHEYHLIEQQKGSSLRKEELNQTHQNHLEEQQKVHLLREKEHAANHERRLEEQTQVSWHRCREIALSKYFDMQSQKEGQSYRWKEHILAHDHRKDEIAWSSEFQLYRDLRLREITQKHALELEQIRMQYAVQTTAISRNLIKSEENSPFVEPSDQTVQMLRAAYQSNAGKPLVLIAPFWDDTLPYKANDEGGFLDYRMAINVAWQKTQWFNNVVKCDGYLKRPLRHTDRDIAIISAELADIPTILIHGMVQGRHRVHPLMTIWNLLPNQGNAYLHLALESFDVKNSNSEDRLEFQNYIAHNLAVIIGILSDAQQLCLNGSRPHLSQYAIKEPEHLKLLANQFGLYYDFVCYQNPTQEHFYRLDQARMLYECQLLQEASQQIDNALTSWYYQKTQKKFLSTQNSQKISELFKLATQKDSQFLTQLAEFYQLRGSSGKAEKIHNLINSLTTIKYKPLAMFKR